MKTFSHFFGIGVAVALFSGCAHRSNSEAATATPTRPSGYVMVREYVDSVKTDRGDVYQKVQYGWDYDQISAVQRISSMDGKLISAHAEPNLTLETTPKELEYAFALVRQHPELRKMASRFDALISGGFSLTTDPSEAGAANTECGAKSRCIHVIISGGVDGEKSLAHAIVNLASGIVVDPHYRGEKTFVN